MVRLSLVFFPPPISASALDGDVDRVDSLEVELVREDRRREWPEPVVWLPPS